MTERNHCIEEPIWCLDLLSEGFGTGDLIDLVTLFIRTIPYIMEVL